MIRMTRMMIRRWGIVLFLIFIPLVAFTQEKDFGIWYGVSAEHNLTKKLEIDLSSNIRTFNNASKIEEAFLEGGITYNFSKYVSLAGSYRITENIEDNNSYYIRHKVFVDFKGNIPVGNFSFSGHLKLEIRTKTYIKNEDDLYADYTGRIKLKAVYRTPVFPVNPYIYVESFCPMFSDESGTIGKIRYSAGLEFRIVKQQSVELEYIFQRDYLPHLSDMNIVSINYDIKF